MRHTMLKTISITDETIRKALTEGESSMEGGYVEYFEEFDRESEDWDAFDWLMQLISNVITEHISNNKVNASLAGDAALELVDLSLVADSEHRVNGYMWHYVLWGERELMLTTRFRESSDMRPDESGIDGCVEIAQYIIALVNEAIRKTDEFYAAINN